MTAINIFCDTDAVRVYSDTLVVDPSGSGAEAHIHKIILLPYLNAVAAVSGSVMAQAMVAAMFTVKGWKTFDAAARDLGAAIDHVCRECGDEIGDWGVFLAGWSEGSGRTECHYAIRTAKESSDATGDVVTMPQMPVALAEIEDEAGRVKLIDNQRASNSSGVQVGGALVKTTVTREGIETAVLKRWPEDTAMIAA